LNDASAKNCTLSALPCQERAGAPVHVQLQTKDMKFAFYKPKSQSSQDNRSICVGVLRACSGRKSPHRRSVLVSLTSFLCSRSHVKNDAILIFCRQNFLPREV